ncbi:methyltransferase family protein [Flavobacteriaceae bacterium MAR_2010_72]|nr:methyltransferase family protein [Flavobacteriaceae bacterium MAR_2010_72]
MNSKQNALTSKTYWEAYYKNNPVDRAHIRNVCGFYDEFWDQFFSEAGNDDTLIEIGGFPGRYLAYLSSKYKLNPICLDYNSDVDKIQSAFATMGVANYQIIQEDFLEFKPKQQYDYVMSNGFVEHFKNFDDILDLHMPYLKSRGKLLIMIPNMRGYIRWYKWLVDYQNLKIHNRKCMSLNVFKAFSIRNNLNILHLGYFGYFPYNVHQSLNSFQKLIYNFHRILFKKGLNKIVYKYPSSLFSSTIIAIFEKN